MSKLPDQKPVRGDPVRRGSRAPEPLITPLSLVRVLRKPGVMMVLIFLLLVYLTYFLAANLGIEGVGGWFWEIVGAVLIIFGMIFVTALLGVAFFALLSKLRGPRINVWDQASDRGEDKDRDQE